LDEFDPPIVSKEGELVCKAKYFNMVPRASRWYTLSQLETAVRLQQVSQTNIALSPVSPENPLPHTCNKREANLKGAMRLSESIHNEILEHITCTAIIDHEESLPAMESYGGDSGDEGGMSDEGVSSDEEEEEEEQNQLTESG
jgi:hypothetical protein